MKTSQQGIDLIKHFESLRLTPYQDSVGVWTVGWGSTRNVRPGQAITETEADARLLEDIERAETAAWKMTDPDCWELAQARFDALVSFCFNLGSVKTGTKLWRRLKHGPLDEVPDLLRQYVKAGGKVLPGLVARREAEARLWKTGDWREPADADAPETLSRGSRGPAVIRLKESLHALGYWGADTRGNLFGVNMERAVRRFQHDHPALKTDGIAGPKTFEGLRAELAKLGNEPKGGPQG